MKKLPGLYMLLLFLCWTTSCRKTNVPAPAPATVVTIANSFAKGADISWLTEMEAAGKKFYNASDQEQDLLLILKSKGVNTVRLRVWVNPANQWNSKADVVAKAVRAKNQGMKIMIDFHYSDTWADPGSQLKPAAWTGQNLNALKASVAGHTIEVLTALKAAGISVDWVQVGNETSDGMLWPDGQASVNMAAFAQLINSGYDAVKSVFPAAKVIVHASNGWDNKLFRWLFDGLKNNGAKWDVIGMSLYPTAANWGTLNLQCQSNMNDMVNRYDKEVMIVEVGMSWDQPTSSRSFLEDLIIRTRSVTGSKGLGVLYWEPEAYNNWREYSLGAFDTSGRATTALDAFK